MGIPIVGVCVCSTRVVLAVKATRWQREEVVLACSRPFATFGRRFAMEKNQKTNSCNQNMLNVNFIAG